MISKKKFKDKTPEEMKKILNEAFLNLYVEDYKLSNPLNIPDFARDEPHNYITWIMSRPEYFYFICKEILNIELLPMQGLILKEIWRKRFPMLIGTRGLGKAIPLDSPIRVRNGWKPIKDLSIGEDIYGSDGKIYQVTDKTDVQNNLTFYEIVFEDNRTIKACADHRWKVINQHGKSKVYTTRQLKRLDTYKKYSIPLHTPLEEEKESRLFIKPYIAGFLLNLSSQMNTDKTTYRKEFISNIQSKLPSDFTMEERDGKYGIKALTAYTLNHLYTNLNADFASRKQRFVPRSYKFASNQQKLEFIQGLFDAFGYYHSRRKQYKIILESNAFRNDVTEMLRSLGAYCVIEGKAIYVQTDLPIFSTLELQNLTPVKTTVAIKSMKRIKKQQGMCISVNSPDHTYITKDHIVTHNSFSLAIYCLLRALLIPKRKVLIAGAAFRQSKVIFNYIEKIWDRSPLLRDLTKSYNDVCGPKHSPEMWTFDIGDSKIIAVPVGPGGDKIRGQRAEDLIVDEFNSVPREVFETVMVGFAAVSSDPVNNVKQEAQKRFLNYYEDLSIKAEDVLLESYIPPNQIVISGTAGYTFEQFYEYWQDWHDIISSKGDPKLLERYINKKRQSSDMSVDDIIKSLDHKDYSIFRIPFEMMPEGFMDKAQVVRSKATMHSATYLCEYAASFPDDSFGFFKRSLIDKCTTGPNKNITHEGYPDIQFIAKLNGDPDKQYIMGIDPASENDNFALVILELHNNHRRVVYSWTTNKKLQSEELAEGTTKEFDYYAYCVLKIRSLMKKFNIIRIILDAEGGGRSIREGLMNERLVAEGEQQIFEVIDPDKEKDTDRFEGLHILEMAKFANAEWLAEANNGLRFDLERRFILFPYFDTISLELDLANIQINNYKGVVVKESLEYCMEEIEELKNELTTITKSKTANGRDRWDTPDMQLPGGKKGKQRKDRYSALVIANMAARLMMNDISYSPAATYDAPANKSELFFIGNQQLNSSMKELYDLYG